MKVLLINPPAAQGVKMVREGRCMQREGTWASVWAPISLATTAAVLKEKGFTVKLLDAIVEKIDFDKLKNLISQFRPELILVNTATGSIKSDLSVARLAKAVDPQVRIAAFGIHVSALPDASFKIEPKLDFIIRGEPEITALELAQALQNKTSLKKVNGLSYREKQKITHNRQRPPLTNLTSLPFPDWKDIKTSNYLMPLSGRPFLLVATGRGCPFNCLFCADREYYGQALRLPSAKRVVDEIENDSQKYHVDEFLFWTESFTLSRSFALEVCQEISKRGLKIRFVVNSRVDQVDETLLKQLKAAGCFMIGFGVESADEQLLKMMKKGITVEQIKKAVLLSKKVGLSVTGHFMLGFPGETKNSARKTITLACSLPFDFAQFYCSVPFPGSKLYQMALKNQWLVSTDWTRFEQNFAVIKTPDLSAQQVMALRRLAYRRFYLRPKIILSILKDIKTLPSALWLLKSLGNFYGWAR